MRGAGRPKIVEKCADDINIWLTHVCQYTMVNVRTYEKIHDKSYIFGTLAELSEHNLIAELVLCLLVFLII